LGRSRSVQATCTGTFTAFCLVLPAQPSSARSSNALVVNRRTRLGAAIRSRRPCHVDWIHAGPPLSRQTTVSSGWLFAVRSASL